MVTNKQIMRVHKDHICNPKAAKGESQLYDKDCVGAMLDEACSYTTNQVFKKLDKLIEWHMVTSDEKDGESGCISKEEYQTLKKRYR